MKAYMVSLVPFTSSLLPLHGWWTIMKCLWKELEVCDDTRGSRWKYIGVYGSSWKLPPNMVVEAEFGGSNGSFHPTVSEKIHILP